MHRRIGFVVSVCGMGFLLLPFSRVLPEEDFAVSVIGLGFILAGVFFSIEALAKTGQKR